MTNYKSIIKSLQKHYPDASDVVIISKNGKVLFSTPKWDVKGDLKSFLTSWNSGTAQSVEINNIRYSVLQMEPERFIGTNRHNKGHLIGASTPDGDMIAHVKPKAKGWFHMAYPAVARAAAMMMKGSQSRFIESEIDTSKDTESTLQTSKVQSYQLTVDPHLKVEIEGFLAWVKNAGGLPSYIYYSLQQNDTFKISQLAKIYYELYRLFYE
ncbi:MAG: hypothetical protein ACFFKA_09485 [Candidatus Thorarchaeota archaeon]